MTPRRTKPTKAKKPAKGPKACQRCKQFARGSATANACPDCHGKRNFTEGASSHVCLHCASELAALRARVAALEKERDEAHDETEKVARLFDRQEARAEAAEAKVKELEANLQHVINTSGADGERHSELCRLLDDSRARVLQLEGALRDIADPIAKLRRDAEAKGNRLDGAAAAQLARDGSWLSSLARTALTPEAPPREEPEERPALAKVAAALREKARQEEAERGAPDWPCSYCGVAMGRLRLVLEHEKTCPKNPEPAPEAPKATEPEKCGAQSNTVGACDLPKGHPGRMHSANGDGFYVREPEPKCARCGRLLQAPADGTWGRICVCRIVRPEAPQAEPPPDPGPVPSEGGADDKGCDICGYIKGSAPCETNHGHEDRAVAQAVAAERAACVELVRAELLADYSDTLETLLAAIESRSRGGGA